MANLLRDRRATESTFVQSLQSLAEEYISNSPVSIASYTKFYKAVMEDNRFKIKWGGAQNDVHEFYDWDR